MENFNKTLRLWGVTESDDGEYECVAENGRGTARGTHSVTVEGMRGWGGWGVNGGGSVG